MSREVIESTSLHTDILGRWKYNLGFINQRELAMVKMKQYLLNTILNILRMKQYLKLYSKEMKRKNKDAKESLTHFTMLNLHSKTYSTFTQLIIVKKKWPNMQATLKGQLELLFNYFLY